MTGAPVEMWNLHIFEKKKMGMRPILSGGFPTWTC
ncbi:hypothetical protein CLV76_11616 [Marivita geojedonensis]|nr:hypothetical protein CLV76_11616 [Marivita geojedonensis]